MKGNNPPKTILGRSARLLGMAAKIATQEVTQRVSNQVTSRIDQARTLVDSLGKLKGAAMKAGQWLALEGRDFFPPEVLAILSELGDQAPALEIKQITALLRSELGAEKFARVYDLAPDPVGAASIGQVHRGRIKRIEGDQEISEEICFKVQYPGIAESVQSDLAGLKKVLQVLLKVGGKSVDIGPLIDELQTVLLQEVDYGQELALMQKYRERMPEGLRYFMPQGYPEFSTPRLLCMSWVEGIRLSDWIASRPSYADREQVGRLLLDLYFHEFLVARLVQTDPNPANFLVRVNPLRLGILDFGATLEYDRIFVQQYVRLLGELDGIGESEADTARVFRSAVEFGLIDAREPLSAQIAYAKMIRLSLKPFDRAAQPFRFGDPTYTESMREVFAEFSKIVKYSSPPRQIIFLHRKLGGVFHILKSLDLELDLRPYWDRMVRCVLE